MKIKTSEDGKLEISHFTEEELIAFAEVNGFDKDDDIEQLLIDSIQTYVDDMSKKRTLLQRIIDFIRRKK
jgi:hypothetical protein